MYTLFRIEYKVTNIKGAIFPTVITIAMNLLVVGVALAIMMSGVGVVAEPKSDPAYHAVPHGEPAYCANGGACVEPVLCSPWYLESLYDPAAACYLGPSTPGVCCAPKKPACK